MANDIMLPIYQQLISEIENIASLRGGWAALWQADALHNRVRGAQLDAELQGWTGWANAFGMLHRAMTMWGNTPVTRPDPSVADIMRQAFEAVNGR